MSIVFSSLLAWLAGRPHRRICAMLIVVMFFVSVSAILDAKQAFRSFDDVALSFTMSLGHAILPSQPLEHDPSSGRVVAVLIGKKMFERDFKRQLPADPAALAKVIAAIAETGPARIAIDIDLAKPIPDGLAGCDARKAAQCGGNTSHPLHEAIRSTLSLGINVIGIPYSRQLHSERKARTEQLLAICDLKRPAQEEAGVFWLASPQLKTLGSWRSVVDIPYFDGQPASLGIAAACSGPPDGACPNFNLGSEDYCSLIRKRLAAYDAHTLPGVDDAGRVIGKAESRPHESNSGTENEPALINYRPDDGNLVRTLIVDSFVAINANAKYLKGKIVFVGLQSFGNLDEFGTPVGVKAGAVVHAYVANSMLMGPLRPDHLLAAVVDFFVGLGFSALAVCTHGTLARYRVRAPNLIGMAGIVSLPLLLVAFAYIALSLMPFFLSMGVWLNPLPMLLGFYAHAYWEAIETGEETHAKCGIFERVGEHGEGATRTYLTDRLFGYLARAAMVGVIAWGAVVIVSH